MGLILIESVSKYDSSAMNLCNLCSFVHTVPYPKANVVIHHCTYPIMQEHSQSVQNISCLRKRTRVVTTAADNAILRCIISVLLVTVLPIFLVFTLFSIFSFLLSYNTLFLVCGLMLNLKAMLHV